MRFRFEVWHIKHPELFGWEKGPNTQGSDYAKNNHSMLIAEMIPCTTLAAERNAFNNALSDDPNTPEIDENKNFNMHTAFMTGFDECDGILAGIV